MLTHTSKRIAILVSVVTLTLLVTWGSFAAAPSTITMTKTIVGGVTTAQPGDVITYRIGILNTGPGNVTIAMTDTLPAGVKLVRKPSRNVVAGSNPTNVMRDVRGKTVGYKADFAAGTGIEIFLPVRVGRCFDTTNKTITNEATISNPAGAGMQTDSVSFTVDCSGTTSMSDLVWSAEFADAPSDNGTSRGWDEGVAAVKGRFMRMQFHNQGSKPLGFKLKMPTDEFRVTLGWNGCLTCVRSTDTGHVETLDSAEYDLTVMPNDHYYMEFYVEPVRYDAVPGDMLPFNVGVCLPDLDDGGCNVDDGAGDNGQQKLLALLFFLALRDYGDAPDRSNHFGAPMNAYPGIPANFPTVHDAATGLPQGPGHINSGNFHLGAGVSPEFLADAGPDFDPANNIEPVANISDLDDADDGVQPNTWVLTGCMTTVIPVQVFISPATVAVAGANPGYINIWIDRNRDGDWADSTPCGPNPANTAYEHVVIDEPVDIAALGAGIHIINVTTGRMPQTPVGQPPNNPAWARVMLTEVPSEKLPGQPNGDGRGRAAFYATGETEDYLLNNPQPFNIGVDGSWGGDDNFGGDAVGLKWRVRFANRGDGTQANFSLDIDTLGQNVVQVLPSNDALTCAPDASGIVCTTPALPAGASGTVLIRTVLPVGDSASLTATADSDGAASASETQTIRGPRGTMQLMEPRNGTVSAETDLHVRGRLQGENLTSRAPLQVYWDDTLVGTVLAGPDGSFQLTEPITRALKTPGQHTVRVVNGDGSVEVSRSLVVDGVVGFDAATIMLTDPATGAEFSVMGQNGRQDTDGFRIIMQGNGPLTMSVRSEAVSMRIRYEDGTTVPMVIPDGEPCVFTVQITPPASRSAMVQKFWIEAIDADGNITVGEGTLVQAAKALTVVNAIDGTPIVTVPVTQTLRLGRPDWSPAEWRSIGPDTLGNASGWIKPCPSHATGCTNAVVTDGNGQVPAYPSEVEQGFLLEVAGFQKARFAPTLDWNGCLTCVRSTTAAPAFTLPVAPLPSARAATIDVVMDGNGFSPAYIEVAPGTVVNFKNVDSNDHGSMSDNVTFAADGFGAGAWDSGILAAGESFAWTMTTLGTFTYVDPQNPLNVGTVVVTTTPTAITLSGTSGVAQGELGMLVVMLTGLLLVTAVGMRVRHS